MTVHKRRDSGYGWYYAGFALAAFGLGALLVMLVCGTATVEFTPLRPIVSILFVGAIAGYLKLRATRR